MNPLVERLGWVLVHSMWQFALVALLAGVTVRMMRRSSAAARYGVLTIALAVSVAAPVATGMLQPNNTQPDNSVSRRTSVVGPDANAAISPKADETRLASHPIGATQPEREVPTQDHATPSVASEALPVVPLSTPAVVHSAPSWSEFATSVLQPWLAWIVVGWSLGVLVCSLRPLLGWHTLRRLQRVGVSPAADEVLATMQRVSARLGLRCPVRVLQSTLAQVPVVVGYLRPMILLPVSLITSIPAAQLEAILAHELAHVHRHDFVVNLLQTVVETLFFYHPAIWWLSHQIRIEREHCCDDLVVKLLGNRVEYGRALLAIEELRGRSAVLALAVADGSLLSRVRRIVGLNTEHAAISLVERWPAVLLGVGLISIASVLSMTWNLAAKDATMTEPASCSATLSNGATVELIGVGFPQAKPSEWWHANGTPLARDPRDTKLRQMEFTPINATSNDQRRKFAIRVTGLPRVDIGDKMPPASHLAYQFSYEPYRDASRSTTVLEPTDFTIANQSPMSRLKAKTVTLRIGIDELLNDELVRSIDSEGKKLGDAPAAPELRLADDLIQPEMVRSLQDRTELLVKSIRRDQSPLYIETAPVAIDQAGRRHDSIQVTRLEGHDPSDAYLYPLARDQISRFEYRLKRYRHWVTFENVSLHPGHKTDVRVLVESPVVTPRPLPPHPPLHPGEPDNRLASKQVVVGPPPDLGPGQRLELVQWSHDSKQVFATGSFDTFVLWRRKGVEWVSTSLGADHHLNSITASRKSPLIVVGTNVGTAEVWDVTNRKRQCEIRCGPEYGVDAVTISLDEHFVAACGTDGTVAVFDRTSQQLITRLGEKADTSMVGLAFSPDGKRLATMDRHGQIVLWSVAEGTRLAEWKGISGGDNCSVQWSPDGKQLAVSGWARVTLIAADNGSPPRVVWAPEEVLSRYPQGDGSPVSGPYPGGIRFSSVTAIAPDVRTVASIAPDGSIGIWDLATRKIVQKLPAPAENVLVKDGNGPGLRNLVFSPDGRRLACTTERGDVVFWQLAQAADIRSDGLGAAERSLHSELSYYGGFSPFRLKQFPQAGDSGRSVRLLDPLVSHLPEKVRTDADRRFNSVLQAIAVDGPARIEASLDRIISDTRDLPAVYRSALMFNLWVYVNDLQATDGLRKLWGLDGRLLDRVQNKCIMAALEQADEIPDGLTLRFLELSTNSLPSLSTADDADWPAKRRMIAELWLTRIEKLRAVIDPHWNPDDRPMINIEVPEGLPMGASPKGMRDPQALPDYEARLEANRRKTERYNQQREFRRLLADLSPRMEEDLVRLYVRQPFHPTELELLLDQHAADMSQRDRIAKSVRLVNAILPNGTQLEYGWPDALAEAGPAGVPALMAAVADKIYPKFIRHDGAWALGLIGDPRAIETLTAVAEDETTPDKYQDIARGFVRALKEGAETTKNHSAEIDPVKELASFQGTWCWDFSQPWTWPQPIGVGTDSDGRKSEKRWVIEGNQITWVGRDGQRVYVTFTIDPFKTPKQIDFTFLNGKYHGKKSIGIYEPQNGNDNNLWLCMTDPGADAPRPTDISAGSSKKQSMISIYKVTPPAKPSAAKELKRLQGLWQMQLCDSTLPTFGGTQQVASKWQWTIQDDKITWSRQGDEWTLKLNVAPLKQPRGMDLTYVTGPFEMDLTYLTGPFKGAKCEGIYGWGGADGQSLMIAIQDPGSDAPRPRTFHMRGDVKTGLMILRPSKPSDAEREIAAFQGIWTLRNFDTGNSSRNKDPSSWPLPKGKGPGKSGEGSELQWSVKQNEITWTSASGQETKASFTIDPFHTPKQIDLTFTSGPHKGETCPGIFQRDDLDENILWLCLADPGSKKVRPKEFAYQWGEGRSLLSLYRFNPDGPAPADPNAKVEPAPMTPNGLPPAEEGG